VHDPLVRLVTRGLVESRWENEAFPSDGGLVRQRQKQ